MANDLAFNREITSPMQRLGGHISSLVFIYSDFGGRQRAFRHAPQDLWTGAKASDDHTYTRLSAPGSIPG
jgi:hypothetical protein